MTKVLFEIEKALKEVAEIFKQSHAEPSPEFMESLASTFDSEWTAFWKVDCKAKKLAPVAIWDSPQMNLDTLLNDTRQRVMDFAEGMPGKVWKAQQITWSNDLSMDMALPRSIYASDLGLKTGVWIPVVKNKKVYGVIEILSKNLPPESPSLNLILERFSKELMCCQGSCSTN